MSIVSSYTPPQLMMDYIDDIEMPTPQREFVVKSNAQATNFFHEQSILAPLLRENFNISKWPAEALTSTKGFDHKGTAIAYENTLMLTIFPRSCLRLCYKDVRLLLRTIRCEPLALLPDQEVSPNDFVNEHLVHYEGFRGAIAMEVISTLDLKCYNHGCFESDKIDLEKRVIHLPHDMRRFRELSRTAWDILYAQLYPSSDPKLLSACHNLAMSQLLET